MDADLLPPESTKDAPRRSMQRLVRHLDLFSGIGGFALAARMVGGIETVGFCEKDPWARKVLTKNFPGVPICEDIREVNGTKYGNIDIITGGFPCQPYSVTGKRNGNADHRALWPEMLRVIRESKPSWVLGENVSGIVSMELDKICADLEAEGYEVQPLLIPACAADAPQERMRCWILADATGARGQSKSGGVCQDAGQTRTQTNGHQQPVGGGEAGGRPREWQPEPGVGRMADGIPNRVDRLRGLGNAIVPQVAAEILRAMMAVDSLLPNESSADTAGVAPRHATDGIPPLSAALCYPLAESTQNTLP